MYDLDSAPLALLTTGNPKTAKGEAARYFTAILHLAPAHLSGRNVCPHSSPGCVAACLNTAGRGGMNLDADGLNQIQAARIRRTRYFQRNRKAFVEDLFYEIVAHVRRAQKHRLIPAIRLNGTSDLPWESFPMGVCANVFEAFPGVQFYDYTKWPLRLRKVAGIANYHLTFSLSERADSESRAGEYLAAGLNVAAVFAVGRSGDLPASYPLADAQRGARAYPVVDGDKTDLRFLDSPGTIVGLRAKGRGKHDTTGFVRHI